MRHNIFIGCQEPWSLNKEVREEWLTRENNHQWDAVEFPFLPATPSDAPLDLSTLPRIWKKVQGFEPIPVERIGPRGWTE